MKMIRPLAPVAVFLVAAFAAPAVASLAPVGTEFQVNTYTQGDQRAPSVAADSDGDFVVVWLDLNGRDGSGYGIFAQRYASTGSLLGSEFQVNTYTYGNQIFHSVAADSDGDFVVVWSSLGQDGSSYGIFAQRYASTGSPLGSEFQVNTFTISSQRSPAVAADSAGDFVVVWEDGSGRDGIGYGIFAQRYASTGSPLGSEFQVNTYTPGSQALFFEKQTVAADSDGDFVVVWTSSIVGQDGSGGGVFAQRYASTGSPLGSEFQVNTYTPGYQDGPSVVTDSDGDFVVVWESVGQDGGSEGLFAQRYASTGSPLGNEFQVNTYTYGLQALRSVAAESDGDFLVAWSSFLQDGSGSGVFAQRYASTGGRFGPEFQVNTYTFAVQDSPSVAADSNGGFVVAWQSDLQDGSGYGVFAQRYLAIDSPAVVELGVTYEDPTIVTGPLSFGLVALPAQVDATFRFVSPAGFPPPLGVPLAPTVLAASLSYGDAQWSVSDLADFSITFDGSPAVITALSYSFDPIDSEAARDGLASNDFELHVEGVDRASKQPFEYLHARSSESAAPVVVPTCPAAPDPGCMMGFAKGTLSVDERAPGKEKMLAKWTGGPALAGTDFGNPLLAGGTAYNICVYNDAGVLAGQYTVDRAGYLCDAKDCWKAVGKPPGDPGHKGYKYKDQGVGSDGVLLLKLRSGAAGESKAVAKGKNTATAPPTLPTGVAAALSGSNGATVQLIGSDAPECLSVSLPTVLKDEGNRFKAKL